MCDYEVPGFGVPQGWQCPICKRVYAPFVSECTNCGRVNVVVNTENTFPDIDWSEVFKKYYIGTEIPKVTLNGTSIY